MTTDQKGAVAETAIVYAATKLGIGVFKPLTDGERYDLIFDLRPKLVRVQCKWAALLDNVVSIRCYSCRRSATGGIRRGYTAAEIDAVGAYCAALDRCYLIPIERVEGRRNIQLRLRPARNNQRLGVNLGKDYEFEARLRAVLTGP